MNNLFRPETLSVLLIFGLPVVAIVGHYWHKTEKAKSDNDLKRRLAESGLSVDEIERVINASADKDDDEQVDY